MFGTLYVLIHFCYTAFLWESAMWWSYIGETEAERCWVTGSVNQIPEFIYLTINLADKWWSHDLTTKPTLLNKLN